MNIVLTGIPGIGKTTVVEQLADLLRGRAGGFVTREVREGGRRTGFIIMPLEGETAMLATRHEKGSPRVGPYKVLVDNLEAVGVTAVERALSDRKIMIVDEIGKMELMSALFRDIILRGLESDLPLVATLSVSRDPFSESIRRRSDVALMEVKLDNRRSLPGTILELLETGGSGV
jgi:nucleoside-triphosphatase THEP1